VIPTLGYGGVAQMLLNYYHQVDRSRIQFDIFCHGAVENRVDEVHRLGGTVFESPTLGLSGLRTYVATLRAAMRQADPYRAIHIHTNYQSGVVALAAMLEKIPKRICHVHGVHIDPKNRRILPIYRRLIAANCNVLLACSREAGKFYFRSRSFRVIPNAITLPDPLTCDARTQVRRELGLEPYQWVLGHVGRFTPEKNHRFLVDVLAAFRRAGENASLVCAGDGPMRDAVSSYAAERQVSEHFRLLGVRTDIFRVLSALDVLLLPSFSEGLPVSIVEAQAATIPSVVSDSITTEVDLGLGLVHRAPLTSTDGWVEAIRRAAASSRPTPNIVATRLRSAGFDVRHSIGLLASIYEAA
jgi:glycosyltransferase EpsF